MSELAYDAALIASLMDDPTFHVPEPPPADTKAGFVFHDGHLWRLNPSSGWQTCDEIDPLALLRGYRKDARADDWFAPRAAQLADDLEKALRDAGLIQPNRKAA